MLKNILPICYVDVCYLLVCICFHRFFKYMLMYNDWSPDNTQLFHWNKELAPQSHTWKRSMEQLARLTLECFRFGTNTGGLSPRISISLLFGSFILRHTHVTRCNQKNISQNLTSDIHLESSVWHGPFLCGCQVLEGSKISSLKLLVEHKGIFKGSSRLA